jgi:hypothetical protein
MIINNKIKLKIHSKNIKNLKEKYPNIKVGEIIDGDISDLSKGSSQLINVSCDYCNKNLEVPYKRYLLTTKIVKKYSCNNKECSNQKIKDVCQTKYGVDNPFQAEFVKEKSKETIKEKWGVEHQMHVDEVKDKIKETCLEKYGVDNFTKTEEYLEKTKKTNLEKYGFEWSLQNKKVREKGKKTCLIKYGFEHPHQSKEVREKTIKTILEKWGVECNLQSEECKEKIKETNLERYGVENPMKSDIIRKKYYNISNDKKYLKYINNKISKFICEKGHEFEISSINYISRKKLNIKLCTICNPIGDSQSIKEKELYEFIKSIYKEEIIQSYRDGLEIDIYLPELKLGFEFNGLYWHSEEWKNNDYHLKKTKYFKEKGIRIIHIWEDDWVNKKSIIESQIKNWLGLTENKIFARKCYVKEIVDSKITSKFLEENHIQGKVGSSLKLGLYHDEELVSLMTFDQYEGRKKMEEGGWNINRFCNKLEMNVIGGASKLFKYFLKKYNVKRVISYSDSDWSSGDLYQNLGFNKINEGNPDYKYIFEGVRVHKSRFRKSKLNTELSESEYMKKSQIFKIWDCGKTKWELYS